MARWGGKDIAMSDHGQVGGRGGNVPTSDHDWVGAGEGDVDQARGEGRGCTYI